MELPAKKMHVTNQPSMTSGAIMAVHAGNVGAFTFSFFWNSFGRKFHSRLGTPCSSTTATSWPRLRRSNAEMTHKHIHVVGNAHTSSQLTPLITVSLLVCLWFGGKGRTSSPTERVPGRLLVCGKGISTSVGKAHPRAQPGPLPGCAGRARITPFTSGAGIPHGRMNLQP
jgi:hypothetical protein